MSSITNTSPQPLESLYPTASNKSPFGTPAPTVPSINQPQDSATVSPAALQAYEAGQIAVNQQTGTISGDQAQQLYSQLSSQSQTAKQINQELVGDGGVTAATSGQPLTVADARQIFQSGRVELAQQSGALSGAQASALMTGIDAVGGQTAATQQADGGTLSQTDAQTINQEQNMLSQEIYAGVNNATSSAGSVGGSTSDPASLLP